MGKKIEMDVCLTPNNFKKLFNTKGAYSVEVVLDQYIQNHKRAKLIFYEPEPVVQITESELRKLHEKAYKTVNGCCELDYVCDQIFRKKQ